MVLRDIFLDLNVWQNMRIVRKSWIWGHSHICTCNFSCFTHIHPRWNTLWTIWKSHKTLDVHPMLPFPAPLMATGALHLFGTKYQKICSKQLKISLLRHQIPKDLLQTVENTIKFSPCDFHGSGRRFCMYRRHPHARCYVEVYNSLHTFLQDLRKSHWL